MVCTVCISVSEFKTVSSENFTYSDILLFVYLYCVRVWLKWITVVNVMISALGVVVSLAILSLQCPCRCFSNYMDKCTHQINKTTGYRPCPGSNCNPMGIWFFFKLNFKVGEWLFPWEFDFICKLLNTVNQFAMN